MKKYLFSIPFILININVLKAQIYQNALNGIAYKEQNLGDVKGSPYVFDDWSVGTAQTSKGLINDINLKYSQFEDQVVFKSKDGQTLQFADQVRDFTLLHKENDKQSVIHYRNGYSNIPGLDNKSYFEVLVDGKCQLLKKTTKKIKQETIYGSTEPSKSFTVTTRYYIETPEKGLLVKKDKKSILSALPNKQQELETYIKNNNIDCKSDEGLMKLVTYYNAI
ncbi:MAG: hypothetical protein EOP45_02875 [Sphingobacteriaceae bacterium]|nr:MAG: hypothetical protein EOP45_02875 [Sphingobacteriaceae bacterium]